MTATDREPLTREERLLADRLARDGAGASPSAALDAAILGAARAAASGRTSMHIAAAPRRDASRTRRWPLAAGIAASLALAVGIAWQLRPAPGDDPRLGADAHVSARTRVASPEGEVLHSRMQPPPPMQQESAAAPPWEVSTAAPAPADIDVAPSSPTPGSVTRPTVASAPPVEATPQAELAAADDGVGTRTAFGVAAHAADAPPPSPASATVTPAKPVLAPASAQHAPLQAPVEPAARPAASPALPAAARQDRSAAQALTIDSIEDVPDDLDPPATADAPEVRAAWLARVRELLDSGRIEEARASLAEFHRRHPQAELPADLRALLD